MPEPIIIREYDAGWAAEFQKIRAMLFEVAGDLCLSIEHVGSTSIEGLAAKPIIDIDLVMEDNDCFPPIKERLEKAGFEHEGDRGIPGREVFRRTFEDGFMTYHLYVCSKDSKEFLRHIAFRDYLRTHSQARQAYQALKTKLAEQYTSDREAYTNGKTHFVQSILQKAKLENS